MKLFIQLHDIVMRRRSLLQNRAASAAGVGLLTGSAAAETNPVQSGESDEILGDGSLRYSGPETDEQNHLKQATSAFNAGKRRGDWSFRIVDGYVQVVPEAAGSPTIQPAKNCKGKSKYEETPEHTFWFNDCQCIEVRNELAKGVAVGTIATIIANFLPGIGQAVAVVTGCATVLCSIGALLLTENNRGKGVKIWFEDTQLPDPDIFEIRPQR